MSNRGVSHRTIWIIASAAVILALIAFGLRQTRDGAGALGGLRDQRAQRDALIAEMLERLEMDHRVRRPETQAVVEQVGAYADQPALATAETYYALGLRKYYGEFEPEAAERAFLRASRLRPDWAWPHNALGIVRFVTHRRQEALESFRSALELDPDWSRPHSDMAILYRRAGEMQKATQHVKQALEIEPGHPINHYNYAVILDEQGRHMEARERYEHVLELAPDLAPALYNMSCSYAREGDLETAIPFLLESIAIDEAFRAEARHDPDFDPVRDESRFQAIVETDADTGPAPQEP